MVKNIYDDALKWIDNHQDEVASLIKDIITKYDNLVYEISLKKVDRDFELNYDQFVSSSDYRICDDDEIHLISFSNLWMLGDAYNQEMEIARMDIDGEFDVEEFDHNYWEMPLSNYIEEIKQNIKDQMDRKLYVESDL